MQGRAARRPPSVETRARAANRAGADTGRATPERTGPGNQARLHALSGRLTIGTPGAPAEREADRIARRVASGTPCHCGGRCASCQSKSSSPPLLRRFAPQASAEPAGTHAAPPEVQTALAESGRPLERSTRQTMESSFGHDFSRVRVHTSELAGRSAESVGALAYTVGSDVVFGRSRYAPATPAGRYLLAHELAHVVQQAGRGRVLRRLPMPRSRAPIPRPSAPAPSAPTPTPAPATPLPTTGCSTDEAEKVTRALHEARTMLNTSVSALGRLARPRRSSRFFGPEPVTASVATSALATSFKNTDARVADHVRFRLLQILFMVESLINGGRSFSIACHSVAADPTCGDATAYVPAVAPGATRRSGMIFCPTFFTSPTLRSDQARGAIAIHELAHALIGGEHIGDRAYSHFRYFPDLTTEEALTNADSYRIFVLHVATGTAPSVGHQLMDLVEDCDGAQRATLDQALNRIQQWLMVAQRVSSDRRPEWLALQYWQALRTRFLGGLDIARIAAADAAYRSVLGALGMFLEVRCHASADATCPAGTPTASRRGALGQEVQLCPDWFAETGADRRALLLLARLLAGSGIATAQAQRNHAELAMQLFMDLGQAPDLRTILGLPPIGDFPERTLPRGVERA